MGMYTELVLKCEVKSNIPPVVTSILEYLFNGGEHPEELPHDEFFLCPRWHMIGRCNSYYHHPAALSSFVDGYLFSRSDLKNYDNEIQKFLNWVAQYLDNDGVIGWVWYEEEEKPSLIYLGNNSITYG